MTEKEHNALERTISEGYLHSSSKCLEAGFRLYRSHFREFALFAIVVPLVGSVFGVLGLGWMGTITLSVLIAPVLNAGFYIGADRIAHGKGLKFADFFAARQYAAPLILNNFLALLISAIILIPTYNLLLDAGMFDWYQEAAMNPTDPPEPPVLSGSSSTILFLNMVPLIYLQVGFSWAFPFILFYNMGPWQSLEQSRRLVTRRWWVQMMLILTFVSLFFMASFLVAGLAAVSIGLFNLGTFGLFLILPWAYCSLYIGFFQATALLRQDDMPEVDREA